MNNSPLARILMLLENSFYPGDVRVRREAMTLMNAGYRVTVVCPRKAGQSFQEIIDGVKVYRFPTLPELSGALGYVLEYSYATAAMFILSFYTFIRFGFDVVHTHNPPDTLVFVAGFYKLFGKRFVFDHHDLSPEMYLALFGKTSKPLIHKILLWLEKFSCGLADHVIATNASYKKIQIERDRVPEERITIVRNGPDLDWVRAPEVGNPVSKKQGKILICYVGSIGHHDGVDYFFRAIKHLVEDLNQLDFSCLLVGNGDALPKMQLLAKELNLVDYVSFTGWVSHIEVVKYLHAADICVAPEPSNEYNDHSTVIKMTEYMAFGKAIVAFDLPEHRVTAQGAALYALPNNEFDFATKIFKLIADPILRGQLGNIGKQRISTKLAWEHQEKHLLNVYKLIS